MFRFSLYFTGMILLFNMLFMPWFMERQIKEVDYGTFIEMAENQQINQVQVQDNQIIFTGIDDNQIYKTGVMDDPELVNRLRASGAEFSGEIVEETSPVLGFFLTWILPIAIFAIIGQVMSKKNDG